MKENIQIGKTYHFWDDGKSALSRHYICKCENIISLEDSKLLMIPTSCWNQSQPGQPELKTLYDLWMLNKEFSDFLFANETPYFVVCSCPKYDDNLLYFCKTKSDNWFSMNIHSFWQGGLLAVNAIKYHSIINEYEDYIKNGRDEEQKLRIASILESHKQINY